MYGANHFTGAWAEPQRASPAAMTTVAAARLVGLGPDVQLFGRSGEPNRGPFPWLTYLSCGMENSRIGHRSGISRSVVYTTTSSNISAILLSLIRRILRLA
jgi:hypothetical protein